MATFSKISRYRAADDVSVVDAGGRAQVSKALRLVPAVAGKFRHLLADGDRADQLAYKYYKQPRKWWRICDANPEFLSPQALLGKDATAVARFTVRFTGTGTPPWAAQRAALEARVGVEAALLEEEWSLLPETQVVDGQEVTVNVEHVAHTMRVTYNRLNLNAAAIAAVVANFGFEVDEPQTIGRVGKPIIVPPDTGGLRA
jgi:hypothetical protein